MTNQEIIQKADLALADLASGGSLNPEQSTAFIRTLIKQPTILAQSRVVPMTASQRKISKVGFGSRILRPAVAATALADNQRAKPDFGMVELNTKEVIAEIHLPYDVIEDNIERGMINAGGPNQVAQPVMGGFKDTLITLIGERAALDLEELALLGDKASGDAYLALLDGYLKLTTTNVVNCTGETSLKTIFKNGLKAMPDQYLRNRAALKNLVSVDNETEYRDLLSNRETTGGDNIIQGYNPVFAYGVPVEAAALMPGSNGLLTFPQNLIFGIQRNISIEVEKDIRARVFIIVLTARVDFQIEQEDAVVKYNNISIP